MRHGHIIRPTVMTAIIGSTLSSSVVACPGAFGYDEEPTVWSTIERMQVEQLSGMLLLLGFLITLILIGAVRYRAISSAVKQSRSYEARVLTALFYDRVHDAINVAALFPKSPLAVVVDESVKAGASFEKMTASQWRFHRAIASQAASLKQDLWMLSAIGWTSPAIGLITALTPSAHYASGPPIALSFGLMIAIPAIWLYRGLSSRVESLLFETDRMSRSIVAQMAEQLKEQFDNQSRVGHHSAP